MQDAPALFQFGETRSGYEVPVLNERAVRAAAGLFLMFAMIAFMNAMLLGNFHPTRVLVIVFLVDFTLRVLVNPRLAPSMIVGQWIVRHQQPEWVGAPQKRFAWAIGLGLASIMFYTIVLKGMVGPINMLVCGLCLLFLFFESAFGICIGCKIYSLITRKAAQACPGGVCEVPTETAPRTSGTQFAIAALAIIGMLGLFRLDFGHPDGSARGYREMQGASVVYEAPPAQPDATADNSTEARCKVPAFARAIGHEDMWRRHNGC